MFLYVQYGVMEDVKFLHPSIVHVGGMFLEVKNFKNLNPKVVLDPNTILKIHHFVVIFHTFGALEIVSRAQEILDRAQRCRANLQNDDF